MLLMVSPFPRRQAVRRALSPVPLWEGEDLGGGVISASPGGIARRRSGLWTGFAAVGVQRLAVGLSLPSAADVTN